jgi:hypothetical protein
MLLQSSIIFVVTVMDTHSECSTMVDLAKKQFSYTKIKFIISLVLDIKTVLLIFFPFEDQHLK